MPPRHAKVETMRPWAIALALVTSACDAVFLPQKLVDLPEAGGPVPDAAKCPATITHDEDADTVDDSCDVCPSVADPTQVDGDKDNVGDACDPAPTDANDRLAFFDPFVTQRPQWAIVGDGMGMWRFQTDHVEQASVTTAPTGLHLSGFTFKKATIEVVFEGLNGNSTDPWFVMAMSRYDGWISAVPGSHINGIACGFGHIGADLAYAELWNTGTIKDTKQANLSGRNRIRVRLDQTGKCSVYANDQPATPVSLMAGNLTGDFEIALEVFRAGARFSSVTVYERVN